MARFTMPPQYAQFRAWARRRRTTLVLWQAVVLGVGMGLVLAGLAMLVLPGPGWGAIILGLIVLASEFAWAQRLLDPVTRAARKAADAALDPRVRRRNLILLACAIVVAAAAGAWYLAEFGPTLDGVRRVWSA